MVDNQSGSLGRLTFVPVKTNGSSESVGYFNFIAKTHIKVCEIFQIDQIKTKYTVGKCFDIFQDITTVNSIAVSDAESESSIMLRQVSELSIDVPVKFISGEIISQFGLKIQSLVIF